MANYTNNPIDSYTTLDTLPRHVVKAGTLASSGIVVYTSGVTHSDDLIGGYIWNGATELRKIVKNDQGNSQFQIDHPFTVSLGGGTLFRYIGRTHNRQASYAVTGAGATVNGVAIPVGITMSWGTSNGLEREPDPIIIDGSGSTVITTRLK